MQLGRDLTSDFFINVNHLGVGTSLVLQARLFPKKYVVAESSHFNVFGQQKKRLQ